MTKITLPEFLKGPPPGVATDQDSRDAEQESPIEDYICTYHERKMMPLSKLYDEALLYASDLHRM